MANLQIPNLPAAIALNGTELMEAVQSGVSVRITTAQLGVLLDIMGNASIFGKYNLVPPTYSDGDSTNIQTDANGRMLVVGDGTAGAPAGGAVSVQSPGLVSVSGTITSGDATGLSSVIQTNGVCVVGIEMPATWTSASMTFQGSVDGSTYQNIYDQYGNELVITVAGARDIYFDAFIYLTACNYVKVRSGTNASPVAQGANRIVKLITAP